MHCVMSGICVSFSELSIQRYKKAIESKEMADAFVEYELTEWITQQTGAVTGFVEQLR